MSGSGSTRCRRTNTTTKPTRIWNIGASSSENMCRHGTPRPHRPSARITTRVQLADLSTTALALMFPTSALLLSSMDNETPYSLA